MVKRSFELSYDLACRWWKRQDLEKRPSDIYRIAEVLEEAGIEVFEVHQVGWLSCAPRPCGIREALSGEISRIDTFCWGSYPAEEPGSVIEYMKNRVCRSLAQTGKRD